MRHQVFGRHLNRSYQHRKALFQNLLREMVEHGAITTSIAKAKAIQGQFDKLITRAKKGRVHDRRELHKSLQNTTLVNRLVDEIAPMASKRTSGYTRLTKIDRQTGDDTLVVRLAMVDYKVTETTKKIEPSKTTKTAKSAARRNTPALPSAPKAIKGSSVGGVQKINAPRKAI